MEIQVRGFLFTVVEEDEKKKPIKFECNLGEVVITVTRYGNFWGILCDYMHVNDVIENISNGKILNYYKILEAAIVICLSKSITMTNEMQRLQLLYLKMFRH